MQKPTDTCNGVPLPVVTFVRSFENDQGLFRVYTDGKHETTVHARGVGRRLKAAPEEQTLNRARLNLAGFL
jgi:hypothetical protein